MIRHIDPSEIEPRPACNDNFARVTCVEILTPAVGWKIKVNRGGRLIKTYTLEGLIELIYIIENSRHRGAQYQAQTEGMRLCVERIRKFGVLK